MIEYSNHKSITEGYVKMSGEYVNPIGPFKKTLFVICTIKTLKLTYQMYYKDEFRESFDSHRMPSFIKDFCERMNRYMRQYPDPGSSWIKEVSEDKFYYMVKEVPEGTY